VAIRGITIERQLLLVEIERRCSFSDCAERVAVGLTKDEARSYDGFECTSCERWNDDRLIQKDIPDWWDEISAEKSSDNREQ
jgi:hypothetical protein